MEGFAPDLNEKIQQVIRSCGKQAKSLAVQNYQVFQKGPGDFVTSVDQALDQQLSEYFSHLFPADGIISEENPESRKRYQSDYSRLWCIDPLDGTQDFIQGDQNYAVLVGLLQEAQPITAPGNWEPTTGWIYAPEYDLMYYGGAGWGVWQVQGEEAPRSCLSSPTKQPHDRYKVIIGDKDLERVGDVIAQAVPQIQFVRVPGSFGLKVMEVVLGQAELYVYFNRRVKLWDTVASIALAKAAGLMCCDLEGNPLSFAPDQIDLETLGHQQSIVVGWASYVELLLPQIRSAIASMDRV